MKAATLIQFGSSEKSISIQEHKVPTLKKDQVLVKIEGFGLNYADVMARNGLYKDAPPLPCVLGYEVVGVIEKSFDKSTEELIGKRVMAFTRFGGYAQYAAINIDGMCEIDEDIPLGKALALVTQYVTAYHAVHEIANVQKGDCVALHAGAGGVGIAITQMCENIGAKIVAMVGSDNKKEFVLKNGADFSINYNKEDYPIRLKEIFPTGLDVVFNSVAGKTFKQDFKILNFGGKLVMYGAASRSGKKWGILSSLNMVRQMGVVIPIGLMMQSKSISGINMLRLADHKPVVIKRCLNAVAKMYQEGKINPVVQEVYNINDIAKAHDSLENRSSIGKIAVKW